MNFNRKNHRFYKFIHITQTHFNCNRMKELIGNVCMYLCFQRVNIQMMNKSCSFNNRYFELYISMNSSFFFFLRKSEFYIILTLHLTFAVNSLILLQEAIVDSNCCRCNRLKIVCNWTENRCAWVTQNVAVILTVRWCSLEKLYFVANKLWMSIVYLAIKLRYKWQIHA